MEHSAQTPGYIVVGKKYEVFKECTIIAYRYERWTRCVNTSRLGRLKECVTSYITATRTEIIHIFCGYHDMRGETSFYPPHRSFFSILHIFHLLLNIILSLQLTYSLYPYVMLYRILWFFTSWILLCGKNPSYL